MNLTNPRAIYGLVTQATPTGTLVSSDNVIGKASTTVNLTGADVAYAIRCILFGTGDEMVINAATGSTSGSTAFEAGSAQVETATAAGTISTAGNASVVVTAAGMTGSPKTIPVAVALSDNAAAWADKVRTALAADSAVSEMFTVGGSTDKIALTRKATGTVSAIVPISTYAANDATLNIALDNGTCAGITTAATSADTTAGVLTSGAKIYDGDGKDFEGEALVSSGSILGILIESISGTVIASDGGTYFLNQIGEGISLLLASDGSTSVNTPTSFESVIDSCEFRVTVIATTEI